MSSTVKIANIANLKLLLADAYTSSLKQVAMCTLGLEKDTV